MRNDIEARIKEEARFMVNTGATIRRTAEEFFVSKSTVHNDVTKKLKMLDVEMSEEVGIVLAINKLERSTRGGQALKRKFEGER